MTRLVQRVYKKNDRGAHDSYCPDCKERLKDYGGTTVMYKCSCGYWKQTFIGDGNPYKINFIIVKDPYASTTKEFYP